MNTIYFPEDGATDYPGGPLPSGNTLQGLSFVTSLHAQLHALSINPVWVDRIPVWVYNNLTVLEITGEDPSDIINFDFVCHHCPALEELSITGLVHSDICRGLPEETTFPRLHSFRFSCEMAFNYSDEFTVRLSRFIQSHKRLRRLYLRTADAGPHNIETLLPILRELRHLEVLGLHTGGSGLDEDMLEQVLTCFPLTLKALHLAMSWDTLLGGHVSVLVRF